jgi:hypothetical protein
LLADPGEHRDLDLIHIVRLAIPQQLDQLLSQTRDELDGAARPK